MIYPVDINDLPQTPSGMIDAKAREQYVSFGMWPRLAGTWYSVYDSNMNSDFGATLSTVAYGQVLVGGWVDLQGGIWSTASGNAKGNGLTTNPQNFCFLMRPQAEDAINQRCVLNIPASSLTSGNNTQFYLRHNRLIGTALIGYSFLISGNGTFSLYKVVAGVPTTLINSAAISGFSLAHAYTLDGSITGNVFSITITDVNTSTIAYTNTSFTDSSITGAGSISLDTANPSVNVVQASRIQTYRDAGMLCSPATLNTNVTTTVTVTGYGTVWTGGTTFSISGVSGASIASQSVNAGTQVATLSITTGANSGALTLSDSTDAYTYSLNINNFKSVTDTGFYFSPNNWYLSGSSYAITNCAGAYFKFSFTGTSAVLSLSTQPLIANPLYIRYSVDGGPFVDANIAQLLTYTLATGLTNTAHIIVIYYRGRTTSIDSWNTPNNGLVVNGITINSGGTTSAPATKTDTMLVYGDSRVEGYNALASGGAATAQDSTSIEAAYIADNLNCEYGIRAFAGIDFTVVGQTNVPGIYTPGNDSLSSWNKYFSGETLLSAGQYINQPTYILVMNLGGNARTAGVTATNEQAYIHAFMTALRTAAPSAIIMFIPDYSGFYASSYAAAYAAYQAATPDANLYLVPNTLSTAQQNAINTTVDGGTATVYSYDGVHPNVQFHGIIATHISSSIYTLLNPASVAKIRYIPQRGR